MYISQSAKRNKNRRKHDQSLLWSSQKCSRAHSGLRVYISGSQTGRNAPLGGNFTFLSGNCLIPIFVVAMHDILPANSISQFMNIKFSQQFIVGKTEVSCYKALWCLPNRSILELQIDSGAVDVWNDKPVTEFWPLMIESYPKVAKMAIRILMPFVSICMYLCEYCSSTSLHIKTKLRNKLEVQNDRRGALLRVSKFSKKVCNYIHLTDSHDNHDLWYTFTYLIILITLVIIIIYFVHCTSFTLTGIIIYYEDVGSGIGGGMSQYGAMKWGIGQKSLGTTGLHHGWAGDWGLLLAEDREHV